MRPFLGSEALAQGLLTRGQLRWRYVPILPDVYVPKDWPELDAWHWAEATWLWTGRAGVITGLVATHLLGAYRIPLTGPVEVITSKRRPPKQVCVRAEQIADDEIIRWPDCHLTTAARTAVDIGRRRPRDEAVAILDALAHGTCLTASEVLRVADRYAGTPGIGDARLAAHLMDGGALSLRETRLRLNLLDRGLPRPQTQITIGGDGRTTTIPLGWPWCKVAVMFLPDEAAAHPSLLRQREIQHDVLQAQGWFTVWTAERYSPRILGSRVSAAIETQKRRAS